MKNIDRELLTNKIKEVLDLLDLQISDGKSATARRVANMYLDDLFKNRNNENIVQELDYKMKIFDNPMIGHDEFIIVKDIPFFSTCEHHLLPFFGTISVGYIPNNKILGLSKIPRVVKYFSKQPQLQEKIVKDICNYLYNLPNFNPKFVIVRATNVKHTCVTARGIETVCSTNTIYCQGLSPEKSLEYKKQFLIEVK